jgi:hypothetical protein
MHTSAAAAHKKFNKLCIILRISFSPKANQIAAQTVQNTQVRVSAAATQNSACWTYTDIAASAGRLAGGHTTQSQTEVSDTSDSA